MYSSNIVTFADSCIIVRSASRVGCLDSIDFSAWALPTYRWKMQCALADKFEWRVTITRCSCILGILFYKEIDNFFSILSKTEFVPMQE